MRQPPTVRWPRLSGRAFETVDHAPHAGEAGLREHIGGGFRSAARTANQDDISVARSPHRRNISLDLRNEARIAHKAVFLGDRIERVAEPGKRDVTIDRNRMPNQAEFLGRAHIDKEERGLPAQRHMGDTRSQMQAEAGFTILGQRRRIDGGADICADGRQAP